jgi:hypothetical protein
VSIRLPGTGGVALLDLLRAPSVSSTDGVTLAGLSYGRRTTTGRLQGVPQSIQLRPLKGRFYGLVLPPASAALLTR